MLRLILLLIFTPLYLFGQNAAKAIKGTYAGWWAMTSWKYVFDENNIYTFSTAGHFGFTNTIGEYYLSGDTLFLKPFPKDKQKDIEFLTSKDTLLIAGDSCIIGLSLRYDYCKTSKNEKYIHQSRERFTSKKGEARKPDE